MLNEWFKQQDSKFKREVGNNPQLYMITKCTLQELEELDNLFFNNQSPEGGEDDERQC